MKPQATGHDRALWSPEGPARPHPGRMGLFGPPQLTIHRLALPGWTLPDLRIAVVADPHVCLPWLTPDRFRQVIAQVNATLPDLIVVAGDLLPDRLMPCRHLHARSIVPLLSRLSAPLGTFAVMGNHDYADDPRARDSAWQDSAVKEAFTATDVALLVNDSRRIAWAGGVFWLVGLDSQMPGGRREPGLEDPDAAFANVPSGALSILLAHEPDCFALGDPRPILQISGHTHGGQGVLFGRRPMTPSRYGERYAIGHIVEDGRHLIVSAGLGYSGLPLRRGVPPEITLIDLRGTQATTGGDPP